MQVCLKNSWFGFLTCLYNGFWKGVSGLVIPEAGLQAVDIWSMCLIDTDSSLRRLVIDPQLGGMISIFIIAVPRFLFFMNMSHEPALTRTVGDR